MKSILFMYLLIVCLESSLATPIKDEKCPNFDGAWDAVCPMSGSKPERWVIHQEGCHKIKIKDPHGDGIEYKIGTLVSEPYTSGKDSVYTSSVDWNWNQTKLVQLWTLPARFGIGVQSQSGSKLLYLNKEGELVYESIMVNRSIYFFEGANPRPEPLEIVRQCVATRAK